MKRVKCTICGFEADNPKVQGMQPDSPTGWGQFSLYVQGEKSQGELLCPVDVQAVRTALRP
jgi:hypothetical protein